MPLSATTDGPATVSRPAALIARRSAGQTILRILASFPIACFTGALATDIAYAETAEMIWADFSAWLLAVGLILGVFAGFAGLIELIVNRRVRPRRPAGALILASLVVFAIAVLDNLVHSRDAWTSVVPLGLALSALLTLAIWFTVWLGSVRPVVILEPAVAEVRP